jgi:DNA polymerase III epsilon subunit-like protein
VTQSHSKAASGRTPDKSPRNHRRPSIPVGDAFVSRLGPAADEMFVTLDDAVDPHNPARPSGDTPVDELRFVALDCETTGQTPHRMVELGAVAFTLGGRQAAFETLVHTTHHINPYARRLHQISSETLGGAPLAQPVLERFARFASGSVLVEHSADAFDTRLVAAGLERNLDADNIDTSRLAALLWGLKDTIGLERLCDELGVHHRMPHHALADAEATAGCLVELIKRGREEHGWHTLGDLLRDGQPPPRVEPAPGDKRRRRRSRSPRTPAPSSGED